MRASAFGTPRDIALDMGQAPRLRDTLLSTEEVRATAAVDVALHPSERESVHLESVQARMRGQNPDLLRVPGPERPARSAQVLDQRLDALVSRVRREGLGVVASEEDGRAVNAMFGALMSLANIQDEIHGARRRGGAR